MYYRKFATNQNQAQTLYPYILHAPWMRIRALPTLSCVQVCLLSYILYSCTNDKKKSTKTFTYALCRILTSFSCGWCMYEKKTVKKIQHSILINGVFIDVTLNLDWNRACMISISFNSRFFLRSRILRYFFSWRNQINIAGKDPLRVHFLQKYKIFETLISFFFGSSGHIEIGARSQ